MGRPCLSATSVERKAAWRRRHGMAMRSHYPSAAAKQAAYRARKQAAQALAARACAAIQQALRTRAPGMAYTPRLSVATTSPILCTSKARAPPISLFNPALCGGWLCTRLDVVLSRTPHACCIRSAEDA